jgi:GNAT superfamily N-acetyltransferase
VWVRRCHAEEWEALRDVRLSALADSPDAFGSMLEEERGSDEARWRGWITGEGWAGAVATFVADEGGRLVGMATGFHPDDERALVHLFAMWVRPDRRKAGVGRALVAAVVRWASGLAGVDHVVLRVTTSNEAAVRFYLSCGFVATSDPLEPLRDGSSLMTQTMRRPVVSGRSAMVEESLIPTGEPAEAASARQSAGSSARMDGPYGKGAS